MPWYGGEVVDNFFESWSEVECRRLRRVFEAPVKGDNLRKESKAIVNHLRKNLRSVKITTWKRYLDYGVRDVKNRGMLKRWVAEVATGIRREEDEVTSVAASLHI